MCEIKSVSLDHIWIKFTSAGLKIIIKIKKELQSFLKDLWELTGS